LVVIIFDIFSYTRVLDHTHQIGGGPSTRPPLAALGPRVTRRNWSLRRWSLPPFCALLFLVEKGQRDFIWDSECFLILLVLYRFPTRLPYTLIGKSLSGRMTARLFSSPPIDLLFIFEACCAARFIVLCVVGTCLATIDLLAKWTNNAFLFHSIIKGISVCLPT